MASSGHEEVKLFGSWGSPFSRRVEIALHLKGVSYKYFEEDLANKSALLVKYNPVHKKVPVLLHNEVPLAESLIILEYIDETWKNYPILPQDPYKRAQARFLVKFLDDEGFPKLRKACWSEEKERGKAVEEAREVLEILENEINDKKFFGGETIGLFDIAASLVAFWFQLAQQVVRLELLTTRNYPKLHKWTQEFVSHPLVKEKLPPKDKIIDAFKARLEISNIASK